MSNRINFDAGGPGLDRITIPAYALRQEGETKIEAVCRAIDSKNRPIMCVSCRHDGTALKGDKAEANHYQVTLGQAVKAGGYSIMCTIWISIPVVPVSVESPPN